MRVWDFRLGLMNINNMCNKHLLGMHKEVHAIWNILLFGKKGYSHHPEVLRWKNHLCALDEVHASIALEMIDRRMNHKSSLDSSSLNDSYAYPTSITTLSEQACRIKAKKCECVI